MKTEGVRDDIATPEPLKLKRQGAKYATLFGLPLQLKSGSESDSRFRIVKAAIPVFGIVQFIL